MSFLDIFLWYDLHVYEQMDVYSFCELLLDIEKYTKGSKFAQIYFVRKSMKLDFYKHLEDDYPTMTKRFVLEI